LNEKISAYEALEYGIVDQVVAEEKLEDAVLETAHRFGRHPASSIAGVKKLVNWSIKDLKDFLEIENREITHLIRGTEFQRRMSLSQGKKETKYF